MAYLRRSRRSQRWSIVALTHRLSGTATKPDTELPLETKVWASLQHLKVEIGADANLTDGSEPSDARTVTDGNFTQGYEGWLIKQARKRNPKIVIDALARGALGRVHRLDDQIE